MSENLSPALVAEIVRRLAQAFPIVGCSFGPNEVLRDHDVGHMLGGLDCDEVDEVGFLIKMGVLKGHGEDGRRVEPAEMLRFLEQHGELWFLTRLEMLRAELRKGLAAAAEQPASGVAA